MTFINSSPHLTHRKCVTAHHHSWVVPVIIHGWRCWGLVALFVGGGLPCWFLCAVVHGHCHCHSGPVIVRGWGWWVVMHVCRCSIHCHRPVLVLSCIVSMCCHQCVILVACPHHHMSLSSSCVLVLFCALLIIVLWCCHCHALVVMYCLVATSLSAMWHLC